MGYFDKIIDFGNLYKAYRKASAGIKSNSKMKFQVSALDGLIRIKNELVSRNYKVGEYNEFKVYDPKERVILACSFKDKIVQHSLCDNALIPILSKLVRAGILSESDFNISYSSWKNHVSHGNCMKLVRDMDLMIGAIKCK